MTPTGPIWLPSAVAEFAGAVLTGGSSTRMGVDKALLAVNGTGMAVLVARALAAAGADPVLAVGGDAAGLAAVGLAGVPDRRPGGGPLGGIATALAHVGVTDVVAVLACDMPAVSPLGVRAVVDALEAHPEALAAVPVTGGRLQPLHAAWRRAALGEVEAALAAGRGAVRDVLATLGAVNVGGLDPAWLANVNAPADLRQTGRMTDTSVPEIDIAELARRHGEGGYVLDVRQPDEYREGHVPGAVLVPLGDVEARMDELPADRPLLVVCRSGGRSAAAVKTLRAAGYDATNVAGGTLAWIDAGHAVVDGPEPG